MKPPAAPPPLFTSAPFATLQRKCACGGSAGASGGCDECKKKKTLQRSARGTGRATGRATGILPVLGHGQDGHGTRRATGILPVLGHGQDGHGTVPSIVHDVLRTSGQPLDPAIRAYFEPRFGHDFSRVRVHADDRASKSAAAVNAHAYTLGSHVAFGAGQYSPGTEQGRALIAHELTHVVQQGGSSNAPPADIRVGPTGDAAEREADRFAAAMTRSEPPGGEHGDVAPTLGPAPPVAAISDRRRRSETDATVPAGRRPPGTDLKVSATTASLGRKPWSPDVPQPLDRLAPMLRRRVTVNPAAAAPDVLRQFNVICPGNFAVAGSEITSNCSGSSTHGCECLCDVTSDQNRTYSITVQAATVGSASTKLFDGSTETVPTISTWPETVPGPNPSINLVAAGSPVEFGVFGPTGNPILAEDWRILEHELCGHARLGGGDGPIGDRPNHDTTINTENTIAAEHGGAARGHYADVRQGESFFNPAGNRSKVKFKLKDGDHYEAP